MLLQVILPASVASVRTARQLARQECEAIGDAPELCDAVELLTSELVTNAVRHAAGGTLRVEVTVLGGESDGDARRVRVEVADRDATVLMVSPPRPDAKSGAGPPLGAAAQ